MQSLIFTVAFLLSFSTDRLHAEAFHVDQDATPIDQIITRGQVIDDPKDLVSDEFKVPEGLRLRTQFWFDLYTKYDYSTHVIHHRLFPWIVFDRIETAPILTLGRGAYWERKDLAQAMVQKRMDSIRSSLKRLAALKDFTLAREEDGLVLEQMRAIPGDIHKNLREASENVRVQLGMRDSFVRGLIHSRKYLTYMEKLFKDMGLPVELTRLPFVESGFNEDALSKVGASGIWQIMPQTGSLFVRVGSEIDERNSPLKATLVAAKLLKKYYELTGDWAMAVTSYNHGPGGVLRAAKLLNTQDLSEIIEKYNDPNFKFASSNFYTSFLAALYAEKYHDEIFSNRKMIKTKLLVKDSVSLSRASNLLFLSEGLKIPISTLTYYNKDLKNASRSTVLPRGYELHLPLGYKPAFTELFSSPAVQQADQSDAKKSWFF